MMKMSFQEKKLVWAVDPFEEPFQSRSHLIAVLAFLSQREKARVEPVYVLSEQHTEEGIAEASLLHLQSAKLQSEKKVAEQKSREILEPIQDFPLLPLRVLGVEKASVRERVQSLVDYAVAVEASLILLGTHARHGLARLVAGSFAETLCLHTQLPVVILGPKARVDWSRSQILFVTDFNEYSDQVFSRVLSFARVLEAKIILFHILHHSIEPILQSGAALLGGAWVGAPEYVGIVEESKRKIADQWVLLAKKSGVTVNPHFESSQLNPSAGASISSLILQYAEDQKVGWIAVAKEKGTLASAVMGSITREIIRQAPCPVWVSPPSQSEFWSTLDPEKILS